MSALRALKLGGEMRRLRRECEDRLSGLPIPHPFTVQRLVTSMEVALRRTIHLLPVDDPDADLRTACGLRVKGLSTTYILFRRRPTPNQTEHTILHELVHEWVDHGTSIPLLDVLDRLPSGVRGKLLDELGPGALVQARTRYNTAEEQIAELGASVIKRQVHQATPPGDDLVSQLESSLSHPVAAPRGATGQNAERMC
ncbi:hypothetical protein OHA98_15990 [Streptomyces sp. NBC_00654]|uniref:hypothetical protein n=1 Tax=Streptomyces sp. NBC_00654 TaxID=2975799 RepID=UPI00225453A1|nr:hypothetical protein [Streptomyces sp. NBC_00654]MCX4966312.1 hypothetical protein [Streptomyces sp. NBC_00654]